MQTAVAEAKKQVEQDKKDIDDTIQNSLLASAEKILESVQDYFNRAEALYSSMYLDCEHRCVQFLLISERLIKCSLYPTPQGENHSGYRVG